MDLDAISAMLTAADDSPPWRPSRAVLVAGVNRSLEFDRIFALPRRAEFVTEQMQDTLDHWLKTPEHERHCVIRTAWWASYAAERATARAEHADALDDHAAAESDAAAATAAFSAVPEARALPEIVLGREQQPDKPQRLRSVQARALADAFNLRGLFAPIGVGHGKFLISVLLITLIDDYRKREGLPPLRWLLLVPANLIKQTMTEIAKARRHWRIAPLHTASGDGSGIRVESYDKLSSAVSAKKILEDYQPDAFVCDECHKLKNPKSGRTRKFLRYFRERPAAMLFAMSGSITRKTIRDYWHLVQHALPRSPPLPRSYTETEQWSQALDDMPDSDFRRAPGALLEFCDPDEIEALSPGWREQPDNKRLAYYGEDPERQAALLKIVRAGYQKRFRETPGIVATTDGALSASLVINERVPPPPPPVIVEAFRKLRTTWRTPNDDEIDGGVSLWRHACELASGFWYRWNPTAPPEWLAARQDWNRFCRYVLTNNRQKLDTPLQVVQAIDRGQLSSTFGNGKVLLQAWREVRDTFTPNNVPNWESLWLVEDIIRWFDEQKDDDGRSVHGVAWTTLDAVGAKVEEVSGGRIKHFGGGAEASSKILTHDGPIICSIQAHGTGKNLQRYSRNLVVHWPSGGDIVEQLLGRTHRPGQDAEEVRFDVYGHALELRQGFDTSLRSAEYIQQSTGATQKLTYATVTRRADEDIAALVNKKDPLWRK